MPDLDEVREHRAGINADLLKATGNKSPCPFGCALDDLDELGYCSHLVGFTNDDKELEPIVPVIGPDGEPTGLVQVIGGKKGKMKQPVLKSDVLVNPEVDQLYNGAMYKAKVWFSSRVYRQAKGDKLAKAS